MSTADAPLPDPVRPGLPSPSPDVAAPNCIQIFSESERRQLMTCVFELAAQQLGRYRHCHLDFENLSHAVGLLAYEQMERQPAASRKVAASLRNGTDIWKRIANRCVIHARAEKVRSELKERRHRSSVPVEVLEQLICDRTEENELFAEVQTCIALLSAERQTVILLRFERGLTLQEIADELKWSKTRAHGCLAAAQVELARLLEARK